MLYMYFNALCVSHIWFPRLHSTFGNWWNTLFIGVKLMKANKFKLKHLYFFSKYIPGAILSCASDSKCTKRWCQIKTEVCCCSFLVCLVKMFLSKQRDILVSDVLKYTELIFHGRKYWSSTCLKSSLLSSSCAAGRMNSSDSLMAFN